MPFRNKTKLGTFHITEMRTSLHYIKYDFWQCDEMTVLRGKRPQREATVEAVDL